MSRKTIQNLIIALVAFVLVVGVAAFGFFNVLSNSQTLEEQIAAVAEQNQQEESLLRLQKIAQSSEGERSELASFFLLSEADSITFLREIESMAPGIGVNLETDTLEQIEVDNKDWIQFTFTAKGSRQDVQNFVQILEIIPYVSRIMSVRLEGDTSSGWEADIIIQVQLLTYDK